MPTYLSTQDVLNVTVSCFANYGTTDNPKPVNLLTWLHSEKYLPKLAVIRSIEDKEKRDKVKGTIPAMTPSAQFTYRKESAMIPGSHTRLIQFDIDPKDNPRIINYADLKAQISNLPFVAYCGLSASGKGYWGLVPIAQPERHEQHVNALIRVFKSYGISLDRAPVNVASLRGYSYDAAPYLPERVQLFELYDEPPKPATRPLNLTNDADTEQKRVEVCIHEVLRRSLYLGANYAEWYAIGCSLANGFGESGRDYYHNVSQNYTGYQPGATDRQFTACLRAKSTATLGTFFKFCADVGIEWKELMPYTPPRRPQKARLQPASELPDLPVVQVGQFDNRVETFVVRTVAEQLANPGATLKPDESEITRFAEVATTAEDYPASWDEPNPPGAKPCISATSFHQWQQQHKYFSRHGVASLTPQPQP